MRLGMLLILTLLLSGCFTDAATRLAYDLKAAAGKLATKEGSDYLLVHRMPSKKGECDGPYRVQIDQAGALIFWCKDEAGNSIGSPATSYHRPYVETRQTMILDKAAGEAIHIRLERVATRAVIVEAY